MMLSTYSRGLRRLIRLGEIILWDRKQVFDMLVKSGSEEGDTILLDPGVCSSCRTIPQGVHLILIATQFGKWESTYGT